MSSVRNEAKTAVGVVSSQSVDICREMAARLNYCEGVVYAAACSLQVPMRGGDINTAAEALVRALANLQDARERLDAIHKDLLSWMIHGGVTIDSQSS